MKTNQQKNSRRKFLWGGLGILSGISILKLFSPKKQKPTAATARMLTEDGKLVEVDLEKIKRTGNKVSDKDVITWVKNKPTNQ